MKKKAVLFINIGSPKTTEVKDVQNYLNRFLMDPFVVSAPYFVRWLFMKKFVIPKRAPRSAEAYKKIWTKDGSPLVSITEKLMSNLNLTDSEHEWFSAMRYSEPEVLDALSEIKNKGYNEIIIFPAYPQYATSSTESTIDYVREKLNVMGWSPKLLQVQDFYRDQEFIDNIAMEVPKDIQAHEFDHVLFSFHGLPQSHLKKINSGCEFSECCKVITDKNKKCYRAQCYQTASLVASKLGLSSDKWSMSFQSRLGPVKWIEPYTDIVTVDLAKSGSVKSLLVFSLAFVTDCLETLEELDLALKHEFLSNGGEKFVRVPCLNDKFYSAPSIAKRALALKK
jgi:protoporphyrin/coproporphyrin ferrochelatase